MSNLYDFAVDLALNPDTRARFDNHSEEVMSAAGLSERERRIVRQAQNGALAELNSEIERDNPVRTLYSCLAIEPGADPMQDPDPFPDPL